MAIKFNPFTGNFDITEAGAATQSFSTITCPAGSSPSADSTADTLNLATGTSGTNFNITGDSATDTITFNIPTASAANRGAVSSADWTTFNAKVDGAGTVVDNRIVRFDSTTGKLIQQSALSIDDSGVIDFASGNFHSTLATLTDAANISWNLNTRQYAQVTIAGNRTLDNPTNMKSGMSGWLKVIVDSTGNRTLSYGNAFKWINGVIPTIPTGANSVSIIKYDCDGTNMYCRFYPDYQ